MSAVLPSTMNWWLHTILGGGLLLLVGSALVWWSRSAARKQRLAECLVLAAVVLSGLSLAPAWLHLSLPNLEARQVSLADPPAMSYPQDVPKVEPAPPRGSIPLPPLPADREGLQPQPEPQSKPQPEPQPDPLPAQGPGQEAQAEEDGSRQAAIPSARPEADSRWAALSPLDLALLVYLGGVAWFFGRWLLGHLALWRLLRHTEPVPERVAHLITELSGKQGLCGKGKVVVSGRAEVPFSFGVFWPTIVLPRSLAESGSEEVLRWVLVHESTHVWRRDAWSSALFGLGQSLYFFLPWFWWLRHQTRLCQEYIADAAAADREPAAYAQFLLNWAVAGPPPALATGVSGGSSDLYRRITMLLRRSSPTDSRCPRRWLLTVGVLTLGVAVLAAGIGLQAQAAPAPAPKKEQPKKVEPKKAEPKKELKKNEEPAQPKVFPEIPGLPDFNNLGQGLPPDIRDRMRQQLQEMRQQMAKNRELMKRLQLGQGFPGGVFPALPDLPLRAHTPGRLGVMVQEPSATLVDQLDLPQGQGLVIKEVDANSAAAKAGLKPHDILLEVAGKAVSSKPAEFVRIVADLKADTPMDCVVLRKGRKETIKGMTLPKQETQPRVRFPQLPNIPFPEKPGVIGNIPKFAGPGVSTSLVRNNDSFTASRTEGDLVLTVKGKVADGKASVEEIQVKDGDTSNTYKEVKDVPEAYRDKVANLVEMVAKGRVGVNIGNQ